MTLWACQCRLDNLPCEVSRELISMAVAQGGAEALNEQVSDRSDRS